MCGYGGRRAAKLAKKLAYSRRLCNGSNKDNDEDSICPYINHLTNLLDQITVLIAMHNSCRQRTFYNRGKELYAKDLGAVEDGLYRG